MKTSTRFDYTKFFEEQIYDTKQKGNYRVFKNVVKKTGEYPVVKCNDIDGVINFTGNDYLALSTHPEVVNEAVKATTEMGVGAGGTRNISGTSPYHNQLEKVVADLHHKERGAIFNSAYLANVAAISVLAKHLPNCVIFSDALNHASIIEGIKLSGAPKEIFRHNDVSHLRELLEKHKDATTKLIVFESVYSMHGTIGKIDDIIALAKEYDALTYLDEVHANGIYGDSGSGVTELQGNVEDIDIISGTFAKGYGTVGGYVVGRDAIIDAIRSFGAGFIFTTSMPPMIAAATIKAIEISREKKTLRDAFYSNVGYLKEKLEERDIEIVQNKSHIVCVMIRDSKKCLALSDHLLNNEKIYVQSINYPTVASGEELLRITLTPLHTIYQLDRLVDALSKSLKEIV